MVLLTGPIPTPAVAHLTRSMACDAGIMLTASHNPYVDNGIKIFGPDGYKLGDELEATVERMLHDRRLEGPEPGARVGKPACPQSPGRLKTSRNSGGRPE